MYFSHYEGSTGAHGIVFDANSTVGWSSADPVMVSSVPQGSFDTGFSRVSAGVIAAGNGTQGNFSGTLNLASIQGLTGAFTPNVAGGTDIGSASLPFANLWVGAAGTNNIKITGTATGARTFTLPDAYSNPVQPSTAGTFRIAA